MMKTDEMNRIFQQCIADYHDVDSVDAKEENPYDREEEYLSYLLYHKSFIDTVQWHLEDVIRDPQIDPKKALEIKRRIDEHNQIRTETVEKIDDRYVEIFRETETKPSARLNTESPAWAIDRLSILALKIYHMQIEAERNDIDKTLKNENTTKLKILRTQRDDLSVAVDQLLEDMKAGKRIMKVYRQMKMYNDPELNPILYGKKKS